VWGLVLLVVVRRAQARDLVAPRRLARLVPAGIVVGAFGLFVLVELLLDITTPARIHWSNDVSLAAAAAVLSNLVNNLPAWLALAPVTDHAHYPALLVGINVGGMLLLWGSLANLLWRRRCIRAGLHISAARFEREGLLVVPLAVLLGALAG
jgi:arsenical pump membrane protein